MVRMKISIVTMWYNECFLAPFFLNHYNYADEINIILDSETNDNTIDICKKYNNTLIEEFSFTDGFDDQIKVEKFNQKVAELDSDWVFVVDADEFIFPPAYQDVKTYLKKISGNLIFARMWQIYCHKSDQKLDSKKNTIFQRRHGDPNRTKGINKLYNKPIIVRPEIGIRWFPGCHYYEENSNVKISRKKFYGSHWANVNIENSIERQIVGRKQRFSKRNIEAGLGIHLHDITEEKIREKHKQHLEDPVVLRCKLYVKSILFIEKIFVALQRISYLLSFTHTPKEKYENFDMIDWIWGIRSRFASKIKRLIITNFE